MAALVHFNIIVLLLHYIVDCLLASSFTGLHHLVKGPQNSFHDRGSEWLIWIGRVEKLVEQLRSFMVIMVVERWVLRPG